MDIPTNPPTPIQPVEEEFTNSPLYDLPFDYRPISRPFTVAIAGPDRHGGALPHLVVVDAHSTGRAWAKALAWFLTEHETADAYVVAGRSFEGAPGELFEWVWTDLRLESQLQDALGDLAGQAAETVDRLQDLTRHLVAERGSILPGREEEYLTAVRNAAVAAWPLVLEMARHDGS